MFWEGCLEEVASQEPHLFLPEPSAWGGYVVTEEPAHCHVGSLITVPLLLPNHLAEGPHPAPSLSLLGTPALAQMLTFVIHLPTASQALGWVCKPVLGA